MLPDRRAHGVLFLFIAVPHPGGTDGHLRSTTFARGPDAQNDVRLHVEGASIKSKLQKTFIFSGKLCNLLPRALA
jgi:hypothetical protein